MKYNHPDRKPEEDKIVILYDGFDEFEGRVYWNEYRRGTKWTIAKHICGWREKEPEP